MNAIQLIDCPVGSHVVHGDLVIRKHDCGVYSINDGGLGSFADTVAAIGNLGYFVNFI